MSARFEVGQTVVLRDVNESRRRGPERVPVVKVGRKLVTVLDYGHEYTFSIEDGQGRGAYGHQRWIQTEDDYAAEQAHESALERLRSHGLRFEHGKGQGVSTETLNRLADVLDEPWEARS